MSTNSADRLEPAQRTAAKVAGALYLVQMAAGIFGELFVRGKLIVAGDATATAQNIAASERLFRLSIVTDLVTYVTVIVLIWSLYVILRPVRRDGALLAVSLRLAENAIAAGAVVNSFVALRFLSGADYLQTFDANQLAVLARVFIAGQGNGLQVAFVFCGLGSAVFSYLWLKSRYIPRVLAAWGIFASLTLALVGIVIMVFPKVWEVLGLMYMVPMFIYEVGLGLWLLIKGLRAPRDTEANRLSG